HRPGAGYCQGDHEPARRAYRSRKQRCTRRGNALRRLAAGAMNALSRQPCHREQVAACVRQVCCQVVARRKPGGEKACAHLNKSRTWLYLTLNPSPTGEGLPKRRSPLLLERGWG